MPLVFHCSLCVAGVFDVLFVVVVAFCSLRKSRMRFLLQTTVPLHPTIMAEVPLTHTTVSVSQKNTMLETLTLPFHMALGIMANVMLFLGPFQNLIMSIGHQVLATDLILFKRIY